MYTDVYFSRFNGMFSVATDQSTLPVKVYVMRRDDYDRIFSNTPYPLWTTVPQWIRPDTVIYTVHAIDADKAEVQYKLESGRFSIPLPLPAAVLKSELYLIQSDCSGPK